MNKEIIILKGEDVLDLKKVNRGVAKEYGEKNAKGKANAYAGKPYWLYAYNGTAFTVNDEAFVKALEEGDVYQVKLIKKTESVAVQGGATEERITLEFDTFRTNGQIISVKTAARKLRLLEAEPTAQEMAAFFGPATIGVERTV